MFFNFKNNKINQKNEQTEQPQSTIEDIAKMLYGNKYKKKENEQNNSPIKLVKDVNQTPSQFLYGVKNEENKENKVKTYLTKNEKTVNDFTPAELLYGTKNKKEDTKEDNEENKIDKFANMKNKIKTYLTQDAKIVNDFTPAELSRGAKGVKESANIDKYESKDIGTNENSPMNKEGVLTGKIDNSTKNFPKIDIRDYYARKLEIEREVMENIANNSKNLLKKSIDTAKYNLQKNIAKVALGKLYCEPAYKLGSFFFGEDTMGMVDLSHGDKMKNRDYIKDVTHLKNFDDPFVAADKKYLKEKVQEQFKDFGFDINKIKGYYFNSNSEPSKRLSQNEDFLKAIKDNKKDLLLGKQISITLPKHDNDKESNWYYALASVDIRHAKIDEQGNLRLKVYDTYDFNKNNFNPFNQAGRDLMLEGYLKPYFSIHDIIIPKEVIDELWK